MKPGYHVILSADGSMEILSPTGRKALNRPASPWLLFVAHFLQDNDIDPVASNIQMPDGRRATLSYDADGRLSHEIEIGEAPRSPAAL